ncbi:MAG: hypothetical protein EA381_12555 [Planctomycetaceae bacterium]|nr:MAG: hypothetical protein EA381_12555 [Planctomycetaceae bacterium]
MNAFHPFRNLVAVAAAAAVVGWTVPPVSAHFIWLAPGGTPTEASPANPETLEVYFGESATPDDPALLERLKEMKLWRLADDADPQRLSTVRSGDTLAAGMVSEGPAASSIYVAAQDFGVRDKGGDRFRLKYYAKAGPTATDPAWQTVDASGVIPFDIVPRWSAGRGTLSVRFGGLPLAGAEVRILGPDDSDGDDFSGQTGADGSYVFKAAEPGRYSIRARHIEATPGRVGDQEYDDTRHYVTLTLDVPAGDGAVKDDATPETDLAGPGVASETIGKLPFTLTSFGGAVLGEDVYIYGGTMGPSHEYGLELQNDSLLRMKRAGGEWETVARGPHLQGLALVAHGEKLYRIGGFEARNRAGEEHDLWSVDSVACFDPATGLWSDLPPLPEPRSSFDAVVMGDQLYVVGGWGMAGQARRVWHETAWRMDLSKETKEWAAIATAPFERRALALAAHDGKFYAIGGISSGDETSLETDIYDPVADAWISGPELVGESGMTGFGASAFATGGDLYITTVTGSLQKLSSDGTKWKVVADLPSGRFFHRMLPISESELLMIGGSNRKGRITEVERLRVR